MGRPNLTNRWVKTIKIPPGIMDYSLRFIKWSRPYQKQAGTWQLFCLMSICQQYSCSPSFEKFYPPARNVLVIMARGLFDSWKQPIFYDFDYSLMKDLLFKIIQKLNTINFKVAAVVCDQGRKNTKLFRDLQLTTEQPYFFHPSLKR